MSKSRYAIVEVKHCGQCPFYGEIFNMCKLDPMLHVSWANDPPEECTLTPHRPILATQTTSDLA